jgi:ABC-2 type transport system permease protein
VAAVSSSLPRLPRRRVVLALVRRDYLVTRSYRLPFLLDVVFGITNLVVYFFISKTFHGASTADLGAAPSFFAFAAVGLVLTGVLQAASASLSARIREEQMTGTLEALVTQPVTVPEMTFGLIGFPFLFAVARASVYLLVAGAWLDVDFSNASWIGFAVVLLAAAAAFSSLGIVLGAVILVVKRGEVLVGLLTFSMAFVSGAYFPVSVLPNWAEAIGSIVPTRFAFDGVRAAIFRGESWQGDALALVLIALVALPLAIWVFTRALLHARKAGTLAQY